MEHISNFIANILKDPQKPNAKDEEAKYLDRRSPLTTTIYVPSHTQSGRLRMKYFSYLGIDPQQKQHMHILKNNRKLHESFFREKIAHHVEAMQNEISEALASEAKQFENEILEGGKMVSFFDQVEVIPIEMVSELSLEEREAYWQGAIELRDTAEKNIIEFEYEQFNWENVIEESGMKEMDGELIHPVFW
mmetsp:Transcript_20756/g.26829  ORF Transcript_20756/g.26829 Transcript_20756/m.26829 type:complete len:191 (+) Transcript_20756:214-786(+)